MQKTNHEQLTLLDLKIMDLQRRPPMLYNTILVNKFCTHALKRSHERCSIVLQEDDLYLIAELILMGRAQLKRLFPLKNRGLYKVKFKGHFLVVIFDFTQLCPVTFLKHCWLAKYSGFAQAYN